MKILKIIAAILSTLVFVGLASAQRIDQFARLDSAALDSADYFWIIDNSASAPKSRRISAGELEKWLNILSQGEILTFTVDSVADFNGGTFGAGNYVFPDFVNLQDVLTIEAAGSQDITLTDQNNDLLIFGGTSTTDFKVEIGALDNDGTDDAALVIDALGKFAGANTEALWSGWNSAASTFEIRTDAAGTGTARPLELKTSGNDNQVVLSTDATTGFSGDFGGLTSGSDLWLNGTGASGQVLGSINFADNSGGGDVNGGDVEAQIIAYTNLANTTSRIEFHTDVSGTLTKAAELDDGGLAVEESVYIKEQAAANTDAAAYGQIWTKNQTPNELWFTDDAGNDQPLSQAVGWTLGKNGSSQTMTTAGVIYTITWSTSDPYHVVEGCTFDGSDEITISTSGFYLLGVRGGITNNGSTDITRLFIEVNDGGGYDVVAQAENEAPTTYLAIRHMTAVVYLTAGDKVRIRATNLNSASNTFSGATAYSGFYGVRLGSIF